MAFMTRSGRLLSTQLSRVLNYILAGYSNPWRHTG